MSASIRYDVVSRRACFARATSSVTRCVPSQMQVEYEERLRQKDAEAVEAQAAFEKQLQKRARRFEAQKNVEADLQAQIDRHKVRVLPHSAGGHCAHSLSCNGRALCFTREPSHNATRP